MIEAWQPMAPATEEIVPLLQLASFFEGGVTGHPAYDVTVESARPLGQACVHPPLFYPTIGILMLVL